MDVAATRASFAAARAPGLQGGLYIRFGPGGRRLRVPLAPGVFPDMGAAE